MKGHLFIVGDHSTPYYLLPLSYPDAPDGFRKIQSNSWNLFWDPPLQPSPPAGLKSQISSRLMCHVEAQAVVDLGQSGARPRVWVRRT